MPNLTALFIFLFVVILTAIGLYFFMKSTGAVNALKGSKEFYEPFLGHFKGNLVELGTIGGKYIFEGQYRGCKFSDYIGLPSKSTADSLAGVVLVTNEITLMLGRVSNQKLLVYTTSPGMVFSMARIRSSDQEFDGKCYVYSDNPSQGQLYLADMNRRTALLRLVEDGWVDKVFSVISLGEKDIRISKFYDPTCSDPDFIKRSLDSLIVLAEGLK